jgi:phosphatidyl-myo-inositol dimannoside synthase
VINRELLLVTPSICAAGGGISRIARSVALACREHCMSQAMRLRVLSLQDSVGDRDVRYLPGDVGFEAFSGNRVRLGQRLLRLAYSSEYSASVFCHVNQAVMALLFPPRRRRFAVLAHGVEVWSTLSALRTRALRSARVWAVSEYTAGEVARMHGAPSKRIQVIHNCLDTQWENISAPRVRRRPYVLSVSRMAKHDKLKGLDVLVEAFMRTSEGVPDVDLVIVGDGDDAPRIRALAARGVRQQRIHFLGRVEDQALRSLYAHCEFFALPSQKEGFGLVFLEAMAFGKAVLAASAAAVPEVVESDLTGVLVAPGSVEETATALARMIAGPGWVRAMGVAGRERARERFSFEAYSRRVGAALADLQE